MAGSNKTTSATTVPAYLSEAGKGALNRATDVSQIGYTPYYGLDVAAMTPAQIATMQGTNMAASAFGLPTVDPMAGMPTATDYGGMKAYSSGAGYDAALAELKARFPGQFAAIMSQFVDPVTGTPPAGYGQTQMGMPVQSPAMPSGGRGGSGGGGGGSGAGAGYTGSSTGGGGLSTLRANLPGGINTESPESFKNKILGGLINAIIPDRDVSKMRPPTAPSRPASSVNSKPKPAAAKPTGGGGGGTRR